MQKGGDANTGGRPAIRLKSAFTAITSGATSSFGQSTKNGIQLAFDEINAAGGVNGKKLEMIFEDDQGRPEKAKTVISKLISQDKVSGRSRRSRFDKQFSRRAGRAGSENSDDYAIFDQSESYGSRRLHFARLFY